MSRVAIGIGATASVGGVAWFLYRKRERSKLVVMLDSSDAVQLAHAKSAVTWTNEEKANAEMPILGLVSAEDTFLAIYGELPPAILAATGGGEASYLEDAKEAAQSAAQAGYEMLPDALKFDLPGVDLW